MSYQYKVREADKLHIYFPGHPVIATALFGFSLAIAAGFYYLSDDVEVTDTKLWLPALFSVILFFAALAATRSHELKASQAEGTISVTDRILGILHHRLSLTFEEIDEILYRTKVEGGSAAGEATNGYLSIVSGTAYHKVACPDEAGLMANTHTEHGVLGLANQFAKLEGLQLGLRLSLMTSKPFTLVAERYDEENEATDKIRQLIRAENDPENMLAKVHAFFEEAAYRIRDQWK